MHCKKEGINLADLQSSLRIKNYIKQIGTEEERVEQFIARCANSQDPVYMFADEKTVISCRNKTSCLYYIADTSLEHTLDFMMRVYKTILLLVFVARIPDNLAHLQYSLEYFVNSCMEFCLGQPLLEAPFFYGLFL